nr:uncharacterized protein LOC127321039 [Lolium perenne]
MFSTSSSAMHCRICVVSSLRLAGHLVRVFLLVRLSRVAAAAYHILAVAHLPGPIVSATSAVRHPSQHPISLGPVRQSPRLAATLRFASSRIGSRSGVVRYDKFFYCFPQASPLSSPILLSPSHCYPYVAILYRVTCPIPLVYHNNPICIIPYP